MNIKKLRILGSNYVGLFTITNDNLCFVPNSIDQKSQKTIENTLDVKTIKTSIYDSSLLAVFAKMNNKEIFLPSFATQKEIELIEKEIKVRLIKTERALGNLIEINDNTAILSKTLTEFDLKQIKKSNLNLLQTNIAKTDTVGSNLLLTNKGFLVNPNSLEEEIEQIQKITKLNGGSSTANTGDNLVRNSILANSKGVILGEATTGFEMNRIEESLEHKEE